MTDYCENSTLRDVVGESGLLVDGDWVESKDQDPNGDVRLIQLADVGDGIYLHRSARFLTSEKAKQLRCSYLHDGDVLIARMPDPIGRACIFEEESLLCVTVVDVCILRPNKKIADSRWLMHLINAPEFRRKLDRYVLGTTRQRISRRNLEKIEFHLPPLAEQERIAEVLDKADALRQKRRLALQKLDTLLQSVFLEMFGDLPGQTFDLLPLEECLDAIIDYRGKSPTKTDAGIPLVTARVIKSGRILEPNEFIAEADFEAWMRRGLPEAGDVVFTTEAPLGEVAQLDNRKVALAQRVLVLRGKKDLIENTFLMTVMISDFVKNQIAKRATGSTVKGIRQKELRKILLPVPPIGLQDTYSQVKARILMQRLRLADAVVSAEKLFSSIQTRAFKGGLFEIQRPREF